MKKNEKISKKAWREGRKEFLNYVIKYFLSLSGICFILNIARGKLYPVWVSIIVYILPGAIFYLCLNVIQRNRQKNNKPDILNKSIGDTKIIGAFSFMLILSSIAVLSLIYGISQVVMMLGYNCGTAYTVVEKLLICMVLPYICVFLDLCGLKDKVKSLFKVRKKIF